jgi:IS30 family transposase
MKERYMTEFLKQLEEKLILHWSPEQISAHLKNKIGIDIGYELIYQYLASNRARGSNLYKLLSHRGEKHKKRDIKRFT